MVIALDIMGGDFAPREAFAGAKLFLEESAYPGATLALIGDPEAAAPYLADLQAHAGRFSLVPATEVVGMHEHPTKALKEKPNSSIAVGFGALARGKADAFVSAGNTGAMLVGAMYSVKAIEGILRPTIASPLPRTDGRYNLLLDVGINADCKPEHLVQFAALGSLYVQKVWGLENPRVGLLNIGEEEGKGNLLAQAAYPLLKAEPGIQFIGNVEGRDLFTNKCDVVVCEGFVGNVALKLAESIYHIFRQERNVQDDFLDQFNYEQYGGTPVLGVNAPVMIGHGISSARAFATMLTEAARIVQSGLVPAFRERFATGG